MSTTFYGSVILETQDCWNCGAVYALSQHFLQTCRNEGGSWHCPHCQKGTKFGETESDRLKKQLERQQMVTQRERQSHDQTKAALRDSERSRIAQKGVTTRLKNRVSKGVCPCCNRYFKDLHRHMSNQHPNFTAAD